MVAQLLSRKRVALSNTLCECQSSGIVVGGPSVEVGLGNRGINWHDCRIVLRETTSPGGFPSAWRGILRTSYIMWMGSAQAGSFANHSTYASGPCSAHSSGAGIVRFEHGVVVNVPNFIFPVVKVVWVDGQRGNKSSYVDSAEASTEMSEVHGVDTDKYYRASSTLACRSNTPPSLSSSMHFGSVARRKRR